MSTIKQEIQRCAPVLVIFFNRPETLNVIFEQVKRAKPKILFLYQDGPRNDDDKIKIEKCRQIVSCIDWDCTVYKKYQKTNIGCDPSEYIAQKWAFSIVDQCIVLEDDDLPSQSFFNFCSILLEKYKNNEKISMISGMNHEEIFDNGFDYLFTKNCSISGWASWSRVINNWDTNYTELKVLGEKKFIKKYKKIYPAKILVKTINRHIQLNRYFYESILIYNSLTKNQLTIVPCKNLIKNIGNGSEGGTHSASSVDLLPRKIKHIFTMNNYELELKNFPVEIKEDRKYSKAVYRRLGWDNPLRKYFRKVEVLINKWKKSH